MRYLLRKSACGLQVLHNQQYRRCTKIGLGLLALAFFNFAYAQQYFDPAFLSDANSKDIDLSRFETAGAILPGVYRVDVYLNDVFVKSRDIALNQRELGGLSPTKLFPCFSVQDIYDLKINKASIRNLDEDPAGTCIYLESIIDQASSNFDLERLRLDLSVPQAYLKTNARGLVPVEEWDNGINALLVNYNFTGAHNKSSYGYSDDSYFLNLNSGLNVDAWRLRNYSTVSNGSRYGSGGALAWKTINSYAQRSLPGIKSSILLGQTATSSTIFNSFGFEGARLSSDDSMLADSERGFAPVVRGIANDNAEVIIRQGGNTIYQTYVSAGPFVINDLYPTSSNGDLQVIIKEIDGRVNEYSVPYSSLPMLQREGQFKYDLVAGSLRNTSYQTSPGIIQGTLAWGLGGGVTGYGGVQNAQRYQAYALGLGQNLGHWGAMSMDMTTANSILPDESRHTGYSLRALYAKTFSTVGTNFKLAGYQYSTRGFYNFSDTASKMMERRTPILTQDGEIEAKPIFYDYLNLNHPKRSSMQLNISQPLDKFGSIYVSGNRQTFWNTKQVTDLFQAGYNASLAGVNYSFSYNYNRSAWLDEPEKVFSLRLSMPLDDLFGFRSKSRIVNSAYASYGQTRNNDGHTRYNTSLSGTAFADNNLSYGVNQSYSDADHVATNDISLNYRGAKGNANAGYYYSKDSTRLNYGLSGGLVAHEDGVTFGQPLGDTNILIKAPGASDVKVVNSVGVKTDQRGYAVLSSASNYRQNRVALDSSSVAANIELVDPVSYVVPTQGALVRSVFDVRIGVRALINIKYMGRPVPFGASVTQTLTSSDSIVGTNGQVFLSGLPLEGQLKVWWKNGSDGSCTVNYRMNEGSEKNEINKLVVECV